MPNVYFVSGLGADERVFTSLSLSLAIQPIYIQWAKPLHKESLEQYVDRIIANQIDLTQEVNLVGLSFGGMVCQEIAKKIDCNKVVIISSVKSAKEMSASFHLLRFLRWDRFIPIPVLKFSNLMTATYFFSTENKKEALLLRQIIRDSDWKFNKWAIDKIMRWDNEVIFPHLLHLHGDKDRIFPVSSIQNCRQLPGGHFMIVSRAKEVSEILNTEFS